MSYTPPFLIFREIFFAALLFQIAKNQYFAFSRRSQTLRIIVPTPQIFAQHNKRDSAFAESLFIAGTIPVILFSLCRTDP